MLSRRRFLHSLPLAAGVLAACESKDPPVRFVLPEKPLQVITSTVQAADLVRQIGGEAVQVRSLIAPETNPHLWQPNAGDLVTIQISDAFFLSGLGLESRFTNDLDELRSRGLPVGVLANALEDGDLLRKPDGRLESHFWLDPQLWAKASGEVAAILTEASPGAEKYFKDRSHEYITRLQKLHQDTVSQAAEIAPRNRFMLTTHDTMAYFGHAYGLEIRSLASAAGEAPASFPPELTTWLTDHQVRTLFREQLADLQTIRTIARPLMLNSDPQIFSLSLGKAGSRVSGISSELEVEFYLQAHQYTMEVIIGRLLID